MATFEELTAPLLEKHGLPAPMPHYRDKVSPATMRRYIEAAPEVFAELNDDPDNGEQIASAYANMLWEHHKVAHAKLWDTVERAYFTTAYSKARREVGAWLTKTVEKRPEYLERLVQVIERSEPLEADQLILNAAKLVDQEQWDRIAPIARLQSTRQALRQWHYTAAGFAERPVNFWLPPTILDNALEQILTELDLPFPLPLMKQPLDDDTLHAYISAAPDFIQATASLPEHIRMNFLLRYAESITEHIRARHRKWWDDSLPPLTRPMLLCSRTPRCCLCSCTHPGLLLGHAPGAPAWY